MRSVGPILIVFSFAATTFADDKEDCLAAADRGQQLRDEGNYRRGREAFLVCARTACPSVVAGSCARWTHEIDDAMPTVVFGAKDGDGNDVTDVRVDFDGEPIASKLDGRPLALDPGDHVLHFDREGATAVDQRLLLRAGEKDRLVNVVLRSARASTPMQPASPNRAAPQATSLARWLASGALLVLGTAASVSGVYFTVQARDDASRAARLRASLGPSGCSRAIEGPCADLSSAVDGQGRNATASVISFVAAGALLAAAVVTFFVWPSRQAAEPKLNVATGWTF